MKILLLDHHVLFRQGLASLLKNEPEFEVVGEADSIEVAMGMMNANVPDLVIIDPTLPNWDGLDAVHTITAFTAEMRVLVLAAVIPDRLLFGSILAGASGCLLKDTPIAKLVVALHAVNRGEPAISRSMVGRIIEEFRRLNTRPQYYGATIDHLTEREVEILIHLGKNASNEEIAERLFISENTVKVHVHNIIKKLNLRNRREAAQLAQKSQLFRPHNEVAMAAFSVPPG
jgi:two-component system NarL family response regulator